jgi:hypothetical protein
MTRMPLSTADRAAVEGELVARAQRATLATDLKSTLSSLLLGGGMIAVPIYIAVSGFGRWRGNDQMELLISLLIAAVAILIYASYGLKREKAGAPQRFAEMNSLLLAETYCRDVHPDVSNLDLWNRVHRFKTL